MQVEIGTQLQYLQEQVRHFPASYNFLGLPLLQLYSGTLADDIPDISVYFYDLPTSAKRRNKHVYPPSTPGSLRIVNLPDIFARTEFFPQHGSFISPGSCASFLCLETSSPEEYSRR